MPTTVAYTINVPVAVSQRTNRDAITARIRSSLANVTRFRVVCVESETRINQVLGVGPQRGVLVATVALDNQLTQADYVQLDAIVFGAFKSTTNSTGWSTSELHSRLAPTGSSNDRFNLATLNSEVSGVSREVTDGASCALSLVQPSIGQRQTVVSGAPGTVGNVRVPPPIIPPDFGDNIPLAYKVAGAVVVVGVGAIAVAYVVRSFK